MRNRRGSNNSPAQHLVCSYMTVRTSPPPCTPGASLWTVAQTTARAARSYMTVHPPSPPGASLRMADGGTDGGLNSGACGARLTPVHLKLCMDLSPLAEVEDAPVRQLAVQPHVEPQLLSATATGSSPALAPVVGVVMRRRCATRAAEREPAAARGVHELSVGVEWRVRPPRRARECRHARWRQRRGVRGHWLPEWLEIGGSVGVSVGASGRRQRVALYANELLVSPCQPSRTHSLKRAIPSPRRAARARLGEEPRSRPARALRVKHSS